MSKTIIWSLVVALVLSLVGVGVYGYSASTRPEVTKVQIADLPIVQSLPLYLAMEKGYFKDAGIEVERVKFEAPNQIVDALVTGQVDFSASAATGIVGIAENKNPGHMKIFLLAGGDSNIQNDAVLVANNSPLKSISDLKGKKLATLPGIQWRTVAQQLLATNNLSAEDVTLVELAGGLQGQALASGQVDAVLGVEPTPTIIKAKGLGQELLSKSTIGVVSDPFYGGSGVVNTTFADQNPNTTARVLAVFAKAVKEINSNPDAARAYLKDYTPLDDSTAAIVPISLFKMHTEFTDKDLAAIQKFYDIFVEFKVVDKPIEFSKIKFSL